MDATLEQVTLKLNHLIQETRWNPLIPAVFHTAKSLRKIHLITMKNMADAGRSI
tara:strand:- start:2067 stop:2228 length:162 start_codon:yes stop_codon:yes gene_type:complete